MNDRPDLLKRVALGAAGGFVGTLVIQGLLTASQKWYPRAVPPLRQDPGEFMVEKAEEALPGRVREHIPHAVETAGARVLALGYGLTFGGLYGAVRPRDGSPLMDGLALGVVTWAAGYLGWLPAVGLMPPVWRQERPQALAPVAEHVAYGVTAVAAYDWLREHV